jgi:TM2 domain-containing membrane protein YozV
MPLQTQFIQLQYKSKKMKKVTVSFLALFLVELVHRFYLGQTAKGIFSLIFF